MACAIFPPPRNPILLATPVILLFYVWFRRNWILFLTVFFRDVCARLYTDTVYRRVKIELKMIASQALGLAGCGWVWYWGALITVLCRFVLHFVYMCAYIYIYRRQSRDRYREGSYLIALMIRWVPHMAAIDNNNKII